MRAQLKHSEKLVLRVRKRLSHLVTQRRFIRYGLLSMNILILGGIVYFVGQSSPATISRNNVVGSGGTGAASNPLDQLSSADIAVNLAQMANLAETTAAVNQADSVSAELSVPPATTTVITKPQVVATALKSRKDIFVYTIEPGDNVASVAAKFNVTSDSIIWSNALGNTAVALTPGSRLIIPPVNGIVYTVAAGDTPDTLATKYRASKEQIIAYNDAELSGLSVGEQIIIPNGQQPVVVRSYSSYSSLGSYTATYGFNGYDRGFCTWYVANKRRDAGNPVPSNLGNASTWDDRAAAAGLSVNKTPSVGAAVVTSQRGAGHVAYVERVNADGSIWMSEMNSHGVAAIDSTVRAGGWNRVDYKFVPAGTAATYNYIH